MTIKEILSFVLLSYGKTTITVAHLAYFIGVLLIASLIQFFVKKIIKKARNIDESKK